MHCVYIGAWGAEIDRLDVDFGARNASISEVPIETVNRREWFSAAGLGNSRKKETGIMFKNKPNVNQKQLRGFGIALPDVVSRYGGSDEMVARIGRSGLETAASYVVALDGLRQQRLVCRETLRAGREKVDELLERVRISRKTLLRSGEAFEGRDLERIADRPREVLSYTAYLLEVARERAARLPFAEVMIADLESHLEPASSAWHAVHLERVALKSKQRDVRSKGLALWRAVLQLRTVLEPKLGTDHPDCLVLKTARMRPSAEGDDVTTTPAALQGNGAAVPATSASG
jgi:hypothetical protein